MAQLREQGDLVDELVINRLRQRYGLGQPMYVQYFKWISGILLRNDWGDSMYFSMPVKEVIGDRILLTFILSFSTLIFSWLISIPVGVYSATHQYLRLTIYRPSTLSGAASRVYVGPGHHAVGDEPTLA